MFGWFGKKEANKVIDGVGVWIDEQQVAPEERIKYAHKRLELLAPFKIVQRIMVSIIMSHWIIWGLNCLAAIWLGYLTGDVEYKLLGVFIKYAKLEMVWIPTSGAVVTYLGGGLPVFNKKN